VLNIDTFDAVTSLGIIHHAGRLGCRRAGFREREVIRVLSGAFMVPTFSCRSRTYAACPRTTAGIIGAAFCSRSAFTAGADQLLGLAEDQVTLVDEDDPCRPFA
jgi:hypothetical protein